MINVNLADEWGGIDKKIKSSVLGLNKLGIETTGSCEGDVAPCPWIMIKSSGQKVKNKLKALLKEFYESEDAPANVKIKFYPVGSRFYIYSGERASFSEWRKFVNAKARAISQGKKDSKKWTQKSPEKYQKEFIRFGKFLASKINDWQS